METSLTNGFWRKSFALHQSVAQALQQQTTLAGVLTTYSSNTLFAELRGAQLVRELPR
jgi:hypothetical protein